PRPSQAFRPRARKGRHGRDAAQILSRAVECRPRPRGRGHCAQAETHALMASTTQPFFIVSSGRSGTAMMERLFAVFPQVEMHHEYMVHHVQPAACSYHMGILGEAEVSDVLRLTHLAAVHYSDAPFWGDSSNKLSWLIPLLNKLFPEALFV